MPSPTHNPGDQPRDEATQREPQGARPGRHPEVERTSGGRRLAIWVAAAFALIAVLYLAMVLTETVTG